MQPVVEDAWRARTKTGKQTKTKEPEYDTDRTLTDKSKGLPQCPSTSPSCTDRKIIPCDSQCAGNAPQKGPKRGKEGFACSKSGKGKKMTLGSICESAGGNLCACCQALLECFTALVKLICCTPAKCYERGFGQITCQVLQATCCLGQDFWNLVKYVLSCVARKKSKY